MAVHSRPIANSLFKNTKNTKKDVGKQEEIKKIKK